MITCSDSAADVVAADTSGPLAAGLLAELGHEVTGVTVVPDEAVAIVAAVLAAIADGARIVVTTGGTGAGPRDVTPDALRSAGLRELPGLGEAIRAASRERIPAADLSRTLGGILDGAVVLALPGSPGGVRDGLAAVGALLEHAARWPRVPVTQMPVLGRDPTSVMDSAVCKVGIVMHASRRATRRRSRTWPTSWARPRSVRRRSPQRCRAPQQVPS